MCATSPHIASLHSRAHAIASHRADTCTHLKKVNIAYRTTARRRRQKGSILNVKHIVEIASIKY